MLFAVCITAAGCFKSDSANRTRSVPQVSVNDSGKAHQKHELELALRKKPGHVPVLLQLAKLESESGQLKKAEGHLVEILQAEPANIEVRLELSKIQFQLGNVEGALASAQAILTIDPEQPDALYNLGAVYGNLGDSRRAMRYWNRLISSYPDSESGKRARQFVGQLQRSAL